MGTGESIINSDVIIKNMKSIVVVTTYDGGDLHIPFIYVRAKELQQAIETEIYIFMKTIIKSETVLFR